MAALGTGAVLHLIGAGSTGDSVWRVAVAILAAELGFEVGRTVVVEHSLGVDTIALVAMVGALALGRACGRVGEASASRQLRLGLPGALVG